jgi:hypothetical protein
MGRGRWSGIIDRGLVGWVAGAAFGAAFGVLLEGCGGNGSSSCAAGGSPPADEGDGGEGGGGRIIGTGTVTNCPTITWVSIVPNELDVGAGGEATLSAMATAPFGGIPVLLWSAPTGTFGDPTAATTTFQCTAPGMVTVTLTASDQGCSTQQSGVITCLASGDGG